MRTLWMKNTDTLLLKSSLLHSSCERIRIDSMYSVQCCLIAGAAFRFVYSEVKLNCHSRRRVDVVIEYTYCSWIAAVSIMLWIKMKVKKNILCQPYCLSPSSSGSSKSCTQSRAEKCSLPHFARLLLWDLASVLSQNIKQNRIKSSVEFNSAPNTATVGDIVL